MWLLPGPRCLLSYAWPGNVRERTIQRACLLSRGDVILPEHLPSSWPPSHRDRTATAHAGRLSKSNGTIWLCWLSATAPRCRALGTAAALIPQPERWKRRRNSHCRQERQDRRTC